MKKLIIYILFANLLSINSIRAVNFDAKLTSLYDRIYPDRFPTKETYQDVIDVPRNYTLALQLAIKSSESELYNIRLENVKLNNTVLIAFDFSVSQLLSVNIEGNTQGPVNVPGGSYPEEWQFFFIRNAPFELLEAVNMSESNTIATEKNITTGALIQLKIKKDCVPGIYTGKVVVEKQNSTDKVELPISFKVHKAVVNRDNFLDCVHWLSPTPIDLRTNGSQLEWWSEEHWQLLERAGRLLYEDGNNMMYTPLVNGLNPLIQSKYIYGQLVFDYTQFDRWINLFKSIGFNMFSGFHLRNLTSDLMILDVENNQKKNLQSLGFNIGCFQETFLKNLNEHLIVLGIHDQFLMHLYDEPNATAFDEYNHYKVLMNRNMPGIKCIDATITSVAGMYSDIIDFHVHTLYSVVQNKNGVIKDKIQAGIPVWLYSANSPFPPYPNRHLDLPLTENRLWPLLALKYNLSGYLIWAVNRYRGADEYATSLGPGPNGNPLHPPGDNWLYYRTFQGLIPSLRMVSFREGMIDVALIKELVRLNPGYNISTLLQKILPGEKGDEIIGYKTDFKIYENNRRDVLNLLDQLLPD